MRFNSWYLTHISFYRIKKHTFHLINFLWNTVFIYIPTRLLPTSSKQQQLAFSIYWKFSTLPILFFFYSKNLLRALKQTKTCSKSPLLSKLAFYDHLVFTRKQTKRWNRLKQNLLHVENWTGLSRQLEEVKSSRRCRPSQFRFRSPCVEVTGVLFCSACSLLEPLAIM